VFNRTPITVITAASLLLASTAGPVVAASPPAAGSFEPAGQAGAEPRKCAPDSFPLQPGVRITSAEMVEGGSRLCRVRGEVRTSGEGAPDGLAHFELNLPDTWNRKMLFLGGAGYDGSIPPVFPFYLAKGYATLGTDSGHQEPTGMTAAWVLDAERKFDEAKFADYAYRARHQVDVKVRPLVGAYYAASLERAYFVGCSGGGREALIEAQMHPDAFDGFIAGNPYVSAATPLAAAKKFRVLTKAPIPYEKFEAIDRAVIADCDGVDGVKDGLVQNPAACAFDPKSLVGKGVLTNAQAEALSGYLTAAVDTRGRQVGFGGAVTGMGDFKPQIPGGPGGHSGISVYLTDKLEPTAGPWPWGPPPAGPVNWQLFNSALGVMSLGRPDISMLDLRVTTPDGKLTTEIVDATTEGRSLRSVFAPSKMDAFFKSGHKLIVYHGSDDTVLDPYSTIGAYKEMTKVAGGLKAAQDSARLFVGPGFNHCAGGYGPNVFDALGAMEAWVEQGVAPAQMLAIKFKDNLPGGPVDRSMPLCPYPAMARYDGQGDVRAATSWSCSVDDRRMLDIGPNGEAAGLRSLVAGWL
jgi:feruloyl esterase